MFIFFAAKIAIIPETSKLFGKKEKCLWHFLKKMFVRLGKNEYLCSRNLKKVALQYQKKDYVKT